MFKSYIQLVKFILSSQKEDSSYLRVSLDWHFRAIIYHSVWLKNN